MHSVLLQQKRAMLAQMKPLSDRLADTKAYVARCQRRHEEASVTPTLAKTAFDEADAQLAKAVTDLEDLEEESAAVHNAATDAGGTPPLLSHVDDIVKCFTEGVNVEDAAERFRAFLVGITAAAPAARQPSSTPPRRSVSLDVALAAAADARGQSPPPDDPLPANRTSRVWSPATKLAREAADNARVLRRRYNGKQPERLHESERPTAFDIAAGDEVDGDDFGIPMDDEEAVVPSEN